MRLLGVLAFIMVASVHWPISSADAEERCAVDVNWNLAGQSCSHGGGGSDSPSSMGHHRVTEYPVCAVKVGSVCARNLTCTAADGSAGTMVNVTVDGVAQGPRCRSDEPPPEAPTVTPEMVVRAARALAWPTPTFVVQPPDGVTLVNLPTNVFTSDSGPLVREVTLLGTRVTIEATPRRFRWDFGDGPAVEGSDPGAPYPALRVTHTYARTGTYAVALRTTFSGRYRVDAGPWQDLPDLLTLDSPAQPLRVVEATPRLVGP